jgi:hypothetical protein
VGIDISLARRRSLFDLPVAIVNSLFVHREIGQAVRVAAWLRPTIVLEASPLKLGLGRLEKRIHPTLSDPSN